jgi:glucose/mannose-6-phosphate isomerase
MLNNIRNYMRAGDEVLKRELRVPQTYASASNLIIAGMGGSGIIGDIIRDIIEDELPKPIFVCKRMNLPAFVDKNSLFIAISYSGNTIETISALDDALFRGCKIIGITSGGKLGEVFLEKKLPYIKLPSGYHPREALPFMLFTLLNLFRRFGWIKGEMDLDELEKKKSEIESLAKKIARKLAGKLIIICTEYPSVGHRFKTQLNENSKAVAKHEVITELYHNEINSWSNLRDAHIIFLRDGEERQEMSRMIEIIKKLLKKSNYTEVIIEGKSKLSRIIHMIWLGDFVSYYLAKECNVDPNRIFATDLLRNELAS